MIGPPRPGSAPYTQEDFWSRFVAECSTLSSFLLCGDFNGHARMSSLPDSQLNRESNKLENAISQFELIYLNDYSPTWFSSDHVRRSILDLALSNPPVTLSSEITVLSYSYGSDHLPVRLNLLCLTGIKARSVRPTCVLKNVDWHAYRIYLDNCYKNKYSSFSYLPEQVYDSLARDIHCALADSGSKLRKEFNMKKGNASVIWWSDKCRVLLLDKKTAYKQFCDRPSLSNFNHFQSVSGSAKKELNLIKRNAYRSFCESINLFTKISTVWRSIRAFHHGRSSSPFNDGFSVKNIVSGYWLLMTP